LKNIYLVSCKTFCTFVSKLDHYAKSLETSVQS
jgi:hypothetical protein